MLPELEDATTSMDTTSVAQIWLTIDRTVAARAKGARSLPAHMQILLPTLDTCEKQLTCSNRKKLRIMADTPSQLSSTKCIKLVTV
mmetsp:Transcript_4802/g.9402  ORF Transcript_4802/g.9402 Transcript_4802/m.9402 type:complete len:86 (+) Transcript_4802:1210-1467(+)